MYFAAIHLFTRSKTKSKISFSPVKKLVAATFGVNLIIFLNRLYTCVNLYLMRRNVKDLTRAL